MKIHMKVLFLFTLLTCFLSLNAMAIEEFNYDYLGPVKATLDTDSCIKKYEEFIWKEAYIPGTDTYKALGDIFMFTKNPSNGGYLNIDLRPILLPWNILFLPFRAGWDLCKTVACPVGLYQAVVNKSAYGPTIDFLKILGQGQKGDISKELSSKTYFEGMKDHYKVQTAEELMIKLLENADSIGSKLSCYMSNEAFVPVKIEDIRL